MAHIVRNTRNGHWIARWQEPNGTERKKSFTRKVEAQRWLDQLQAEIHQGRYIDPSAGKTLVAVCAQRWCDGLVHLKPSTLERYRGIVNRRIIPVWGDWQIARITPNDVNGWIGTLVADGLRPSSVRQTHRVLSLILDAAVQDERIGRNPAHGARLPRPTRTEPMYLNPEQVGSLAEAAGSYELMILTLAFTGLRFGELAALKVGRFDPFRKRLNVVESVPEVGSQLVWTTPKTHQARSVPVPGQIAVAIEEQCRGKQPGDLIFTSPLGTLRLNNWRKNVFDPACKTAALMGLRPHDLRHTAASLAIQSGANVKVVQQMLGHASAAMTLDVYAGLFEDDLDSVAERLDSLTPQRRHKAADNVVDLADAMPRKALLTREKDTVGPVGLEPTTYGLKVRSSAN